MAGKKRTEDEKKIYELKALAKPYLGKIVKHELAAAQERKLITALLTAALEGIAPQKSDALLVAAGIQSTCEDGDDPVVPELD